MEKGLNLLSKAPTKKAVAELFSLCYRNRHQPISQNEKTQVAALFKIDVAEAVEILEAIKTVITETLYYNLSEGQLKKFLEGVKEDILNLIVTIVTRYQPEWKTEAVSSQVSLPRMKGIDWRIDIKSSSDQISRMSVPTVIVDFKVEGMPTRVDTPPETKSINFELSKDALEIVLEGMNQIKRQLDQIN